MSICKHIKSLADYSQTGTSFQWCCLYEKANKLKKQIKWINTDKGAKIIQGFKVQQKQFILPKNNHKFFAYLGKLQKTGRKNFKKNVKLKVHNFWQNYFFPEGYTIEVIENDETTRVYHAYQYMRNYMQPNFM